MSHLENKKVGLFFGSDTGMTSDVTDRIVELWNATPLTVIDAQDLTVEDFDKFDILILGLSTWYDGQLQSDMDDFFEEFKTIDFSGKLVALYGLGDQFSYGEYFVDGIGILGKVVMENNGKIIGHWPIEGYDFEESVGQISDTHFIGLALDDMCQDHLTDERIGKWLVQIEQEMVDHLKLAS